ncbi:MAG: ABC transporter substrate-binding protein [Acidimicrobiales bacterium]
MNAQAKVRRLQRLLALLLAVGFIAAACGSSDDDTTAGDGSGEQVEAPSSAEEDADGTGEQAAEDGASDGDSTEDGTVMEDDDEAMADGEGFPRDVETASGTVTIEAEPASIVSLSATSTEMLFAIGAGDLVAAVDIYSNYPAEAPEGTLDGFSPDLEAILSNQPDLVVASGLPEDIAAGLTDSGVALMLLPAAASFDDTYDQIAQLGEATGHIDEAAALNADIRQGIDQVISTLPDSEEPIRVFHEIDDSFYTATSASFIGQVYSEMGFDNIADPLDDGSGFPLVDGESVIAADPSLIVFTSQASYTADDIVARPGWDGVSAVARGNIVQVDADIASRWGPRIVEFMEAIAGVVTVDA